ncbi:hypothetical protein F5884DRAFT_795356 [Xylogone sp. PMI_703]|nr:hypothetical protein F5884DRAFT_795356 [Xylogone sp. PMI_703]
MPSVMQAEHGLGIGIELFKRAFNQSEDPRVGSARDNATSTSLTTVTTGTNSASFSALVTAFIPISIYAAICMAIFLYSRRLYPRVYAPRSFLSSLEPHERSESLPKGFFNWMKPFYKIPDTAVLHRSSLDGFLFLRYLKVLCVICFVGCCITWPILMPIHTHGGGSNRQLDALTFGNVKNVHWYYIHAFLAWIYFGFIIYMISRECLYFISIRQAYLLSPYYANRLSSRTVLFTCVPQQLLNEQKIRRLFGDGVKNIWIPRDTETLDQLVKEREQTAVRLEQAEYKLIKMANVERNRQAKEAQKKAQKNPDPETALPSVDSKNVTPIVEVKKPESCSSNAASIRKSHEPLREPKDEPSPESPESSSADIEAGPAKPDDLVSPADSSSDRTSESKDEKTALEEYLASRADIPGSVAAQWVPAEKRPSHRPLANMGRKVDTIRWTRKKLKELTPRINKMRKAYRSGKGKPIPAVFVEFHTLTDAQGAYQILAHHRAFHMSPEIVGVRPQEIIWSSMRMMWWERIIRRFFVQGSIAAMVVFWSIPSAVVGLISNVNWLSSKVPFLHWVKHLPSPILGLISGLVPAIALSILMSIVPAIMRGCARAAGCPTKAKVELFVQHAYFIFQVVQVFLVTTLASAASASIGNILGNPTQIRALLSANLPKASNFYVSYFLLQGLAMSAGRMVQFVNLIRYSFRPNASEKLRVISKRWYKLRRIHWGSVYPVFTNMAVIAISYSIIAPIVLGFAAAGLFLVYLAYRYNLLYVYDSEFDTRGLCYPRALKQTLVGLYLAEICLFGLFTIANAFGPVVIIVGLLIFTILVHISLDNALGPLLYNLPKTLSVEEEAFQQSTGFMQSVVESMGPELENNPNSTFDASGEHALDETSDFHGHETTRGIEGAEGTVSMVKDLLKEKLEAKVPFNKILNTVLAALAPLVTPDPNIKPNFFMHWLHPEVYDDYLVIRQSVPEDLPDPSYNDEDVKDVYLTPAMWKPAPTVWIPRDVAGVSAQECEHSGKVVSITDEGAWLDADTCGLIINVEGPSPVVEPRVRF